MRVFIGAVYRDPRRFDDPDRLDIARRGVASLSFGSGPYVCIDAALALVESEVVFRQLSQRRPACSCRRAVRVGTAIRHIAD